jgi:hypothetical protein
MSCAGIWPTLTDALRALAETLQMPVIQRPSVRAVPNILAN